MKSLHPIDRRRLLALSATSAMALGNWPLQVSGAEYPGQQPIRLIVPFPPGGLTDTIARLVAAGMGAETGGTVIVENVPGATGSLGLTRAARAMPDGYTIVLSISASHSILPAMSKNLPYKPDRDFVPLGRLGQAGTVVLAHPSLPASNLSELLALARKAAGPPIFYASWGNGSGGHLTMEAVNHLAQINLLHVPYKGEAPLLQAMLGAEVAVGVASIGGALPYLRAGKLKALGVTGSSRSALLPEVGTLTEQGVPFDASAWIGLFAPARTPEGIVDQLSRALAAVQSKPEYGDRLSALGVDGAPTSREAFERQIGRDAQAWAKVIATIGVQARD